MRQPASSEVSPQSPDLLDLKPPLSSALSSLNVHLEEELARYRRQRQGRPVPPSQTSKTIKPSRKPLDLIAVKAESASQKSAAAAPKNPPPRGGVTPPPPPPNPFLNKSAASSPQHSENAAIQSVDAPEQVESAGALVVMTPQTPPEADAAYALASHPNKQNDPDGYLASSEGLIKSIADRLKPKSDKVQGAQAQFPWSGQLTTPMNVGSFLLLLVISAGLGYVGTNPKAVNHLFGRFWPEASTSAPPAESTSSAAGLSGKSGFRPLGPDLSNQEFVDLDLDALSTLPGTPNQLVLQPPTVSTPAPSAGTATPAPQSTANVPAVASQSSTSAPAVEPSIPPASAPPAYSSTPPTAVNPRPAASPISVAPGPTPSLPSPASPAPQPVSSQALPSLEPAPPVTATPPQITTPVPAAAAAPEPVISIPSVASASNAANPSVGGTLPRYRVVTPYTGDLSLIEVRGVVADAFVRESQIQAGAFADETAANARVQELQEQGISAQVHVD